MRFKVLFNYIIVGLMNTSIHWIAFIVCLEFVKIHQSVSNVIGFAISVTFSFFANSKITFKQKGTLNKYIQFIVVMGLISYSVGYTADRIHLNPILTLMSFSSISLVLGFLYSRFVIFRE